MDTIKTFPELRIVGSQTLTKTVKAVCNLNGGSFQQDVLVTHNGWQYVAFYRDVPSASIPTRHVCLGRRHLGNQSDATFEVLDFEDYDQTEDDGHNIISLGICPADGSIHLSFDCHNTPLIYRHSLVDLTTSPETAVWGSESFSEVLNVLPGLEGTDKWFFTDATYPRFLPLLNPALPHPENAGMLLEYRVGMSGLGDDLLFTYTPDEKGVCRWESRGLYLKGVGSNAYINGIDCDPQGTIHVSWCYRDFVPATLEQARQQAGPNGPENNHDLYVASSPLSPGAAGAGVEVGVEWYGPGGREGTVAVSGSQPITPDMVGARVWEVPKYGGVLNQEGQCLDSSGGVHVLNREFVEGVQRWIHYRVNTTTGAKSRSILPLLPPSLVSARGKLVHVRKTDEVWVLLPMEEDLVILGTSLGGDVDAGEGYVKRECRVVWRLPGAGGNEVLFDRSVAATSADRLSLFFGRFRGTEGEEVRVVDVAI